MKGILADINIAGQVRILVDTFYASDEWSGLWTSLGIACQLFAHVGLDSRAPDDLVWQTCQDHGLILITGNRNKDGPTSLETTIRERLKPDSLPVVTVSRPKSLGLNSVYTAQVGIRLLDYLLNIDKHHGTGRLYVP